VNEGKAMAARAAIAAQVADFYERYSYPPPVDDLESYRLRWDDGRRRAESFLFWPDEPYRDDRSILVAGCGTSQAAHYAARWPKARVVGIDVSETSIAYERKLKEKHRLDNLELRRLAVEKTAELQGRFDCVVCTGVLHHLADPAAGLAALRDVLAPDGAMHLMVYAPYGRTGIYMLQEYCRRLGVGATDTEIHDLIAALNALPRDHPIVPVLKSSPDFSSEAGIADALLHPNDRAYTVTQFMELLNRTGLAFGRWLRQAPYLPWCGAPAATPHAGRLQRLPSVDQYAALELFRGTMVRHSAIVYQKDRAGRAITFDGDSWLQYVPVRLPDTIVVHERLPPGAAAVLINRSHTFADLFLPVDAMQERMHEAIDGARRIVDMGRAAIDKALARDFFETLWRWDQVAFDATRASVF
jgi:SAM-dependent methyltransferase